MLSYLSENLANIIICGVLIAIVTAIVTAMVRNRRKGKSSCGCGCSHCSMGVNCHKIK